MDLELEHHDAGYEETAIDFHVFACICKSFATQDTPATSMQKDLS